MCVSDVRNRSKAGSTGDQERVTMPSTNLLDDDENKEMKMIKPRGTSTLINIVDVKRDDDEINDVKLFFVESSSTDVSVRYSSGESVPKRNNHEEMFAKKRRNLAWLVFVLDSFTHIERLIEWALDV